ncbi:MAG: two-component sensor histidine kinase, partial [Actinomycetia bacterium]|nr:two-component sensor histidine kinase [Actinomycetes bacterium]
MRTLGLRGRVILGFAAGALLLSVLVTLVTDIVSARYLVDQRERAASRQAVVNGLFVESRLTREGADPSGALGAVRLGTGAEAILVAPDASASTAIGLTTDDLPAEFVTATEAGQPSVQISRSGGAPVVVVGVPLQGGYTYYEVTELENLDTTLQTIIWAGVVAALVTSLLGAALGWWAARRVLRPLNAVAQAATTLAGGALDARA